MNASREELLFGLALTKPSAERSAFLDRECGNDKALRARIDALLSAHEQSEGVLAEAAPVAKATMKLEFADVPDESIGQKIGRYKILERVGEGGCGVVYVAEQTEPVRRRVALKVIKLGMDTKQVVARFDAERQALAMMDHPNIAKVLDAGTTDLGRPFFVMELVRGIRITDYCNQANLTTKERLDLFISVCHAIQHAHQKGIIHRDIKPSNILVTLHDGVPVPKVIDFGIAKATEGRLTDATVYTQLHQFIGTPAYMSPEQAEMSGLDIDTRSDIYSLGVLLYELLAGSTPFDGQELMASGIDAMRKTIREKEPVRPSTKLSQTLVAADVRRLKSPTSDTPSSEEEVRASSRRLLRTKETITQLKGDLDWIVMKCLEKDRTRRYETANGLAADLKRHLNNEPVVARPPSTAYRFQKAFRRNKLVFTAATAVAAALVLGIVVSVWQAARATRAKHDAVSARLDAESRRTEADNARKAETEQRVLAESSAAQAKENETHSRKLLYAADMNLAQQSLQMNNVGRARRLLDRHRPAPGEEDLRGWEWRYLWQQCRSDALATLATRSARGFSVSFSPDGTLLAAGYLDGRIELWDVVRRVLLKVLETNGPNAHVAFSPRANLLAATGDGRFIKLHDLSSGGDAILWQAPGASVRDLSFSADGTRLLAFARTAKGSSAVMFDTVTGRSLNTNATAGITGHMGTARLSSDQRRLYLGHFDYRTRQVTAKCLDPETGKEFWSTKIGEDYGLSAMALSPDDRVLVTGTGYEDPTIRVWDAQTGKLLAKLEGHTGWVCELAFSRDGLWLASAAADQSIRLWNTSDWTEAKVFRGHGNEVHAVTFSPDGRLLASGGKDGAIMLWDVAAQQSATEYRRLPAEVQFAAEVSLGNAVTFNFEEKVNMNLLRLDGISQSPVQLPVWYEDGSRLTFLPPNLLGVYNRTNWLRICEVRDQTLKILADFGVGTNLAVGPNLAREFGLRGVALAFCPRQRLVAWGDSSGAVHIANVDQPAQRIKISSNLKDPAAIAFSPDGKLVALTGSLGQGLELRDTKNGKLLLHSDLRLKLPHTFFVDDGRGFVAICAREDDGQGDLEASSQVVFWDLAHAETQPVLFPERGYLAGLAASLDGRWVSVCSQEGFIVIYDARTRERNKVLYGHMQGVHGSGFSPDAKSLASGSGGQEAVKLWHVETGQELLSLRGTGSILGDVQFVDRGNALIAGSPGQNGTWQMWRAPTWEEIATAEAKEKAENKQP